MTTQPSGMTTVFASVAWFLAGWFVYDATAFMIGLPRQATPVVALAIAGIVWLGLHSRSMERPAIALAARDPDGHLRSVG